MDIFDQATEREEKDRALAMKIASQSAPALPYCGCCYNCGATTPPSVRFCDKDCCDDYQKRERAKRMQ